jgi:hypothetical protein
VKPVAQSVLVLLQAMPTRSEEVFRPGQSAPAPPGAPSWQVNSSGGRVQSLPASLVPSAVRI